MYSQVSGRLETGEPSIIDNFTFALINGLNVSSFSNLNKSLKQTLVLHFIAYIYIHLYAKTSFVSDYSFLYVHK